MMLETMQGQKNLPRWTETVFGIICRIEKGTLSFTLPDGRTFGAKGAEPGPAGHFDIADGRLFGRMVRDGEMGFAEAYMDGWWDSTDQPRPSKTACHGFVVHQRYVQQRLQVRAVPPAVHIGLAKAGFAITHQPGAEARVVNIELPDRAGSIAAGNECAPIGQRKRHLSLLDPLDD